MALTKKERDVVISECIQNIATGKTKHFILQYLTKQAKLSTVTANSIYEAAVNKIRFNYHNDKEQYRDIITYKHEQLYQEAYSKGNYGTCVNILREISELQGLKTTNINVSGEVSEATASTLIEQLQVIMITFDKGMGNVIDQSIAAAIGIQDQSQASDPDSIPE